MGWIALVQRSLDRKILLLRKDENSFFFNTPAPVQPCIMAADPHAAIAFTCQRTNNTLTICLPLQHISSPQPYQNRLLASRYSAGSCPSFSHAQYSFRQGHSRKRYYNCGKARPGKRTRGVLSKKRAAQACVLRKRVDTSDHSSISLLICKPGPPSIDHLNCCLQSTPIRRT